jgi:hypothetical protein
MVAPIMPAFCTSSMEMRLDSTMTPSAAEQSVRSNAPANLSSVVPPNIFAENQALVRLPKRRGVDGTGLRVQLLSPWQSGHCICYILTAHSQIIAHHRYCAVGLGQTLKPTHAASSWSDKAAAARREHIGPVAGQPHPQHDPVGNTDDGQFRYFGRRCDNSFGVTEAQRKIFEVVGCRH